MHGEEKLLIKMFKQFQTRIYIIELNLLIFFFELKKKVKYKMFSSFTALTPTIKYTKLLNGTIGQNGIVPQILLLLSIFWLLLLWHHRIETLPIEMQ